MTRASTSFPGAIPRTAHTGPALVPIFEPDDGRISLQTQWAIRRPPAGPLRMWGERRGIEHFRPYDLPAGPLRMWGERRQDAAFDP